LRGQSRYWRAQSATAQASLQGRKSRQDRLMSEKPFIAAAKLDEVPPGTKKLVELNGTEVVLCNTRDQIFAIRNLCSHAYEKLDCGRMKNGWIACPVHGARFDLETGEPMNPPAVMKIDTFAVQISGDTIEVAV
jgi:3-phenylpropionate/trans-cinnamate dioxygenase ferredoxin subunit